MADEFADDLIPTDSPIDPPVPASAEPSVEDRFISHGHKIIRDNLARARQIGGPQITQLLPVIEATLHELFSHFTTDPKTFAEHQDAVKAQGEADLAHARAEVAKAKGAGPSERALGASLTIQQGTATGQQWGDRVIITDVADPPSRCPTAAAPPIWAAEQAGDTITGGSTSGLAPYRDPLFDPVPPALPPA